MHNLNHGTNIGEVNGVFQATVSSSEYFNQTNFHGADSVSRFNLDLSNINYHCSEEVRPTNISVLPLITN